MSEELNNQLVNQQEVAGNQHTAAQQLRIAREALGLSRDEVAAELRLHVRLITALEENDRSQLPATAFIGGYLRAYSKLLGLPADQLVTAYLAEGVVPSSYRPTDRSGAKVVSSNDPKFRFITVAVVGVLLLLFGIWWANDRYDFVGAPQGAIKVEEQAAQDQIAQGDSVVLPMAVPELRDPPQEESTDSAQDAVAESAKEAGTGSNTEAAAVSAKPNTPIPSAATVTEPLTIPPPATVAISEPLAATVPQSILRLEYQAASWTQVVDAQGRTLVYDLVNPGRRMELRGVAPFKVSLGYAPGVLLYYNGALYSHAAYHRGDLARFTVGAAQDNKPLDR